MTKFKYLARGVIKSIPGIEYLYRPHQEKGGAQSARYCYSVWLRHLTCGFRNGLQAVPETVAELGPGPSLGIAIAALLSGAKRYFAFDIVRYPVDEENLKIFDELVDLFRQKAPMPGQDEFPNLKPRMQNYAFPTALIQDDYLRDALDPDRLASLRDAVKNVSAGGGDRIHYIAPWNDDTVIRPESVDMILSQAVLEHVDDLEDAYRAMRLWLKPGGLMSHTIDFKSHGTAAEWNGHWTYSDMEWQLIKGRQKYLLNREPYSTHRELLHKYRFRMLSDVKTIQPSAVSRFALAKRFKHLGDDLTISGVFFQAVKE